MDKFTTELVLNKVTAGGQGDYRTSAADTLISNLYIKGKAFNGKPPNKIRVTVEVAD